MSDPAGVLEPVEPVLAVDLGGTGIKAEVLDANFEVLAGGRRRTPSGGGSAVLDEVVGLGTQLLREVSDAGDARHSPVRRVGLAVPGIIDAAGGIGVFSANLGWRDEPVAKRVAAGLGLPVVLAHDVAAAGLAEQRLGAGVGSADVAVVVIGTGIAAALISGGRVITGGLGQAGELGHVVVRPGGPACGCGGRGCLETIASAAAIARRYEQRSGQAVDGASEVRDRLGLDPDADAVWAEAVEALADALLITLALLGCSRLVVGGGLAAAGEDLLGPLRVALMERRTLQAVPQVCAAVLGPRAGLAGAALAARDPAALGARIHEA